MPRIVSRGGGDADATPKKKSDVVERVVAAVGMGTFLAVVVKYLGESGLIGLILLLQMGMFGEVCSVVDSHRGTGTTTPLPRWHRWLWFFTAQSATSLCALVSTTSTSTLLTRSQVDLLSFSLVALSLVTGVVFLNSSDSGDDTAVAATDRFRWYLSEVATSVLALTVLLGGSSCLILTLRTFGLEWLGFSLLLVITNDTAAYVFGRWLGRHALLPRLSPKKTWEGFVGALVTTVLVAGPLARGLSLDSQQQQQQHAVIALAVFGSLVAPFGGFLASAVKRAHGAKDFGALIPGHGGLVDRLDCQLVMAPFVYLYLRECS
jgi:phosphatidate cytidylyltransferase/cell division cycle 2-like protein